MRLKSNLPSLGEGISVAGVTKRNKGLVSLDVYVKSQRGVSGSPDKGVANLELEVEDRGHISESWLKWNQSIKLCQCWWRGHVTTSRSESVRDTFC